MWTQRIALFERPPTARDAHFNTPTGDWEPIAYEPGSPPVAERFRVEVQDVAPARAESVRQGLAVGSQLIRLRMRWRDDIDPTMRVTIFGDTNRVYQIVGGPAEIMGRKKMLELLCERYTTDGGAS